MCIAPPASSGVILGLQYTPADCNIHSGIVLGCGPQLYDHAVDYDSGMVLAFGSRLYEQATDSDTRTGMILVFGTRLYEAAVDSDSGTALLLGTLGYTPVDDYDSRMVPLSGPM